MSRTVRTVFLILLYGVLVTPQTAPAREAELNIIRFPERRKVEFNMVRSRQIPEAEIKAKVDFREGQNWIEVEYKKMKPAVLFAGEVTCYVLWAINRDGGVQNLGELWVRPGQASDKINFSTGLRTFGLMITAEAYFQVEKPSDLVISVNSASDDPQASATPLTYSDFAPAPEHGLDSLTNVAWDGKTPLDVVQAEKALATSKKLGAEQYALSIYNEAELTLRQARQMARSSRSRKGAQDFARRSFASSNEAIKLTLREVRAKELDEAIAKRRQEMEDLETRAANAERQAQETRRLAEKEVASLEQQKAAALDSVQKSNEELAQIQKDKKIVEAEKASLESNLSRLRDERTQLQNTKRQLEGQMQGLQRDKSVLEDRLQGALSQVADTKESARGYIVNLPGILFDVDKSSLKSEAKVALAKMAGILLIMQDLNLRVEGHTDSTGSAEYNMNLSRERAESVVTFLSGEGIADTRMMSVGYGLERPIADNATSEGRANNRRVEVVIGEGQVAAEPDSN